MLNPNNDVGLNNDDAERVHDFVTRAEMNDLMPLCRADIPSNVYDPRTYQQIQQDIEDAQTRETLESVRP